MKTYFLGLLLVLGILTAQGKEINPALLYYQAILLQGKADDKLNEQIDHRLGAKTPEAKEFLDTLDNCIKIVRKGAAQTIPCDWGIDISDGPETLLPQLAAMKSLTQKVCARAVENLKAGKETEALADYKAAFYLSRHVAADPILISALVGYATENITVSSIATNFARFSNQGLTQIAAMMAAAPPRAQISDSLKAEKASFLDWATDRLRRIAAAEGSDKAIASIRGLFNDEKEFEKIVNEAGGSVEGLIKLHEQTGEYYLEAEKILVLPYPQFLPAYETFEATIRGSGNPVLTAVFPSIRKSKLREVQTTAHAEMLRTAILYRLNGPAAISTVTNPVNQAAFTLIPEESGFSLEAGIEYGTNKALRVFYPTK